MRPMTSDGLCWRDTAQPHVQVRVFTRTLAPPCAPRFHNGCESTELLQLTGTCVLSAWPAWRTQVGTKRERFELPQVTPSGSPRARSGREALNRLPPSGPWQSHQLKSRLRLRQQSTRSSLRLRQRPTQSDSGVVTCRRWVLETPVEPLAWVQKGSETD